MNAKNMSRRLALVAAILSVFMLLTLTVLPTFAEEATGEANTEVVTEEASTGEATTEEASTGEAETGEATTGESETGENGTTAGTTATTEAATTGEAKTEAATENEEQKKIARTTGIINLIVGGVLVIAVIALAFVFRKKIPSWVKALKSECGKIVWCPKDKLKKNTFVVLVTIVILAAVIGLLDFAFSRGIMLLRDIFQG